MSPILFLDIDGVLNSQAWYRNRPDRGKWCEENEIDPDALWLLQAVVLLTQCEVVISSSWRIGRDVAELERLLPEIPISGMTPVMGTGKNRGDEVEQWLADNCSPDQHYVVVDDNSDFYDHQPRVRTDWNIGLTIAKARQLVECLSQPQGVNHGE